MVTLQASFDKQYLACCPSSKHQARVLVWNGKPALATLGALQDNKFVLADRVCVRHTLIYIYLWQHYGVRSV